MTQPHPQCPKCGAERADWLLCAPCSDRLKAQLLALPGLLHELHVTLTRQARMGSGGAGGKGKERPLPFNVNASDVSDTARMTLLANVKLLDIGDTVWIEDICTCHPYEACRGWIEVKLMNHPTAWSLWLADRVERIRGHEAAAEIADEIDYLTRTIKAAIDRPADVEFYGKCGVCEADLYAPHGSVEGYCRKCKTEGVTTTYDPAANRAEIQAQVEHRWGTATECARVLGLFGLEVSVQTIKDWRRPNRHGVVKLEPSGFRDDGVAVYRYGDVMDLCRDRAEQKPRRKGAA